MVSGIGFLGAGSILLRGEIVRGLTTAASLWSVAAIGLAVGGGLYTASIAATVIILIILAGIKPLEWRFITFRQRRQLSLLVTRGALTFHSLHDALGASSPRVKQFVVQQSDDSPELDEVMIVLSRVSSMEYESICKVLRGLGAVKAFREDGPRTRCVNASWILHIFRDAHRQRLRLRCLSRGARPTDGRAPEKRSRRSSCGQARPPRDASSSEASLIVDPWPITQITQTTQRMNRRVPSAARAVRPPDGA